MSDFSGKIRTRGKKNKKIKGKLIKEYHFNANNGFSIKNFPDREKELEEDGKYSMYFGKHPIREGTRPQKFFMSPSPFKDFFRANKKLFENSTIDAERCIVAEGCWMTNKITMQRTMVVEESFGSHSNFFEFLDKIKPVIFKIIKKIPFKILPECFFEDVQYSIFNTDTYAGFRYDKYLNKKNKSSARNDAITIAKERWNYMEDCTNNRKLIERKHIIPSIYTIGARNKRDYTYEPFEEITSRAVHMPEYHVELTASPWIDQITEHIKEISKGAIYIGNSFIEFQRLAEVFRDSEKIYEGDWKRYDSTLYFNIKICGIALLRCFYDLESTRIDNHFIAIADSMLICDYYTPGGDVYRLLHGLPSGVKATNLLGSLINLIALGFCVGDKNIKYTDFVVGGDDFLFSFKRKDIESNIEELEERAKILGMKFKFLKEKKVDDEKLDERPCFFKYTIKNGEPIIPFSALYERVLMPWNKVYKNNYEIYEFLRDLIPSLAAPAGNCIPFYYIYKKIIKIVSKTDISIADIYKYHKDMYENIMLRKSGVFYKEKSFSVMSNSISEKDKFNDSFLFKTFGLSPCKLIILRFHSKS